MKRQIVLLLLVGSLPVACAQPAAPPAAAATEDTHQAAIETWRTERVEGLTSETGWLTLTALHHLAAGTHSLGAGADADLQLPQGAPQVLGSLRVTADGVDLLFDPAIEVTADGRPLASPAPAFDAEGNAVLFEVGPVNFFVIERGGVYLLRVRDRSHPARQSFAGIDYFPIDEGYRFAATFEAYEPIRQIPIANVIGQVSDSPNWGAVVFEHEGETHRIDALAEPGDEELFLIFADTTSGQETYGAGRYLYVDAPDADGRIELDFNKAYNPPCAFTPYATCPLPPRQNRLSIRIPAGEKNYTDSH